VGATLLPRSDWTTYIQNMSSGTGEDATSHPPTGVFKDYLYGTVMKERLAALYKTQRDAAEEAGFDKLYNNEFGTKWAAHGGDKWRDDMDLSTAWSAMYLDTAKDMPVASSAEELAQQLHEIEILNDRTPKQRNYLAQKVQTRYWMQQAVQTGGSNDLMHYLYGRDSWSADPSGTRTMTLAALQDYEKKMADYGDLDFDNWLETQKNVNQRTTDESWESHLDTMPGFTAPWQNAGEGMLPTLTGTLSGREITDFMDDYRSTAYTRMGTEAADTAFEWIQATGKLDPNLKLEGTDFWLRVGGILDDVASGDQLAFDEYTGTYVLPGANSKWTSFNIETGDYDLTAEGRQEKDQEKGTTIASLREQVLSLKHRLSTREVAGETTSLDRHTAETDKEYIARLQADLVDLQAASAARKQVTWADEFDWDAEAKLSAEQEATRAAARAATIASLREQVESLKHRKGTTSLDRQTLEGGALETDAEYIARLQADLADLQAAGSKQAATVTEYDWDAEAAASAAEQARRDAEAAASAAEQASRDAWAQKMIAQGRAELQREHDDALIAKWQRDYDDARRAAKQQSQIDAWRAQGAALGLLPDARDAPVQDPDVPDPYVNSHGSDTVEHTHAISVPSESIDHEEQNFVPISAAFRIRLDALEGRSSLPESLHVPAADVKVI